MTFRPNNRARVYSSWRKAVCDARGWGNQTGFKYRVARFRDGWIVRRTSKRIGPFPPPVGVFVGEVRMKVVLDTEIMFPTLSRDEAVARLRSALAAGEAGGSEATPPKALAVPALGES